MAKTQTLATIVPVVLSGGTGSRLWPVSRASFPKQLWSLVGARSMLQETMLRGSAKKYSSPVIVCNEEHRFLIAEQAREVLPVKPRIILEPVGRNSAAAITASALLVSEENPQAVLWVMPADADIKKTDVLTETIEKAAKVAQGGQIVTLGMTPTRPETGYGYIEQGEGLSGFEGVFKILSFREKPTSEKAESFLKKKGFFWNSGMFVFRADVFLDEMKHYAPDIVRYVEEAVRKRNNDLDFIRLDKNSFEQCPDISIDYALAEKTKLSVVIPVDLGWSDVGSWDALWDISNKDENNNVLTGDVITEKARDCYVRSDDMLTAVVGLDDVVVVTTTDAVLVANKKNAQDVKNIVDRLKIDGRHEALLHRKCYRPWGFYESLILGDRFQVKRIVVKPGEKLSLQKHFHRSEHWVVVAGVALVTRDEETFLLRDNESTYLPQGCVHRLENPGKILLEIIEVQSGVYLDESDIVRLEDSYNR